MAIIRLQTITLSQKLQTLSFYKCPNPRLFLKKSSEKIQVEGPDNLDKKSRCRSSGFSSKL